LAFEIFHNIKEAIVYIWLVDKLNFDLVKVAQRILIYHRQYLNVSHFTKTDIQKLSGF